jgi:hypothetical protein
MNGIIGWILNSGLVQTQVKKFVANMAAKAAVAVITLITSFMVSKGYTVDQALSQHIGLIGTATAALIVAIGQVCYDALVDPRRVNVALKASAQTGEVVKPSQAPAIVAGKSITLPSGQVITIGKPSPTDQTDAQERAETAALNKAGQIKS